MKQVISGEPVRDMQLDLSSDLLALPSDWRLVRVGKNKAPIAGKSWFDADNFSPDDALGLNASGPPAWGLKSGPASGVVVLDLDGEGWDESFQKITGHPITDLPATIGWTSGKPGRSGRAFQVDQDWWPHLRNRAVFSRPWREGDPLSKKETQEPMTLWELRGDRHQAVIIGAHPETEGYQWLPGRSPQEIGDPAPAPEWLLDALLVQELPEAPQVVPSQADAARAEAMLGKIPAAEHSSYDSWLRIGMALHHTDVGLLNAWVDWSRDMASFNEAECLAKWDSFDKGHKGRPATIRTLHHLAKQYGYQEPKRQRPKSKVVPGRQVSDAGNVDNADQHQQDNKPPASWAELIGRLPNGWVVTEQGTFPSKLSAGQLARMLEREQSLIRYNELTMFCEVHTLRGWCAVVDAELDSAYVLLSQMGWIIGAEPITKAVCHVARLRSFHPVKQYLLALEQKGSVDAFNLDEVATKFFRAGEPLHVAMFRKWLIGAVARAMNPGCQMDYCLVLQSRQQGLMKSTSFRDLASPDWFTSTVPDADKDFLLNVHSCWIFELAELESVTGKRDAGRLKNLITTSVDTFRVPYGRTAERRMRGSVFCGTVNEDSFLKDPTGNRRYWVVPIEGSEPLDREGLKAARDGIWKAAMAAWRAGELPMLSRAQEALSEIQNETFVQSDPWLAMLDIAITERPDQWRKPFSTANALLAAKLKNEEQISRADETRIAPLLRQLGFEKAKNPATTDDGKRVRLWSAAQPAQPCTTSNDRGCAPPEPLRQRPSQRAAQPAQPIHSERLKKEPVKRGSVADPWGETPYVGETVVQVVHPPLEPLVQQGFNPAQPQDLGVVQGCAPTAPPSPTWLPQLLAIRTANPGQPPAVLVNLLQAQHGVSTNGRSIKALLSAWDEHQPAAST